MKFLADQLVLPMAQHLCHERIDVGDFAGAGVEQEDAVLCCFKEPAVADFRSAHFILFSFEGGDVQHHGATVQPGGREFGFDSDDLARLTLALKFNINGLLIPTGKDFFKE